MMRGPAILTEIAITRRDLMDVIVTDGNSTFFSFIFCLDIFKEFLLKYIFDFLQLMCN